MKKPSYVLDSYALLAYLQGEPSGQKVKELLLQADTGALQVWMSHINLGEVVYIVGRRLGDRTAREMFHDIQRLPLGLVEASPERILAAALVKAHHAISYADAFVVALAQELGATVVTGDPGFRKVQSLVDFLWLSSHTA